MKTFWNITNSLNAIDEWQPNCWIQVTCPTESDEKYLEDKFQIPDYFSATSAIPMSAHVTNTTTDGCLSSSVSRM